MLFQDVVCKDGQDAGQGRIIILRFFELSAAVDDRICRVFYQCLNVLEKEEELRLVFHECLVLFPENSYMFRIRQYDGLSEIIREQYCSPLCDQKVCVYRKLSDFLLAGVIIGGLIIKAFRTQAHYFEDVLKQFVFADPN